MNLAVVRGQVSRPPELRSLPGGAAVVSLDLVVRAPDQPAEAVPVACAGPLVAAAERLEPGAEVVVVGRVRRRFFRSGGGTQSRTELVAEQLLPATEGRRVRRALAQVAETLAAGAAK